MSSSCAQGKSTFVEREPTGNLVLTSIGRLATAALGLVLVAGCSDNAGPATAGDGLPPARGGKVVVEYEDHRPLGDGDEPMAAAEVARTDGLVPAPDPASAGAPAVEDRAAGAAGAEHDLHLPPEEAAVRLADALAAYESAEDSWQRGDFEDAFADLDRAYHLMASVPMNGDAALAQEKDNLRRLISRRLVEIYASRQTAVGDLDRSIPLVMNDDVAREIRSFQGRERQFFLESYQRSGLYRPMMVEELRRAGLPEQLSWLPLVESGFKTKAFSSARALGLWQFIASTGLRYDLHRTPWIDRRMDPVASTRGAIGYLTDLHGLFGDWLTALAGYNCGENAVLRVMQRQPVGYMDRFWDLYQQLPRETRRYVPRFLAVLHILEDPAKYGFELPEPYPAPALERFALERSVRLDDLDAALGLEKGTLASLNPELRVKATPPEPYELWVPAGAGERIAASLDSLPEREVVAPQVFATHRVRSGETLSRIAASYGASVEEILKFNRLRSAHRIHPGQRLQVPDRRRGGGVPGGGPATTTLAAGEEVRIRVQSGDSLWVLARRHGTTVDRIRRDNNLGSNTLQPGQELVLRTGSTPGGVYRVRRGDTLGIIAQNHGVSLGRLLRENNLSSRSTIHPGQTLRIPN